VAKYVKRPRPPPQDFLTRYEFEVQILRVNKRIHDIGLPIFHSNNLTLLSMNHLTDPSEPEPEIPQHLLNNGACMWSHKLARFKGIHFRLHIVEPIIRRGTNHFRLICADDIPILVNVLRMIILATESQQNRMCFKFIFELKPRINGTRLSTRTQRELLLQFESVRGHRQRGRPRGERKVTTSVVLPLVLYSCLCQRSARVVIIERADDGQSNAGRPLDCYKSYRTGHGKLLPCL